jgi:thioredoxin
LLIIIIVIIIASEFDRLMKKHATQTGLPVIVDFYSDGCGPCRMIAPIFKKLAKEMEGKAVFVKVDTNAMYELSSRYGVRSLPTFKFFLGGRKVYEFSGAGEAQLRQFTQNIISKSEFENVILSKENLMEYYSVKDATKSVEDVDKVYKKCVDQVKDDNPNKQCVGGVATNLVKSLKKKYGDGPKLEKRFEPELTEESKSEETGSQQRPKATTQSNSSGGGGKSDQPNLHLASKEQLLLEIEKRLDAERDAQVEDEEDDDDDEYAHSWSQSPFPERVTIIGGGPAGLSAAIYASRAGLKPVVVAPPMGGQLQGKGVDVENYPGLFNVTGPAVVSLMRQQAIDFGTSFEAETVLSIDATSRPFKVKTNTSVIETHAIIVATGAESNWLNVPGEYEMRGGGVSSCATCDGHMYRGKHVLVVGGGDTAMEDALVLARTSEVSGV